MFSILTPSLNQGIFLSRNLASVGAEANADDEHIVIDGGSTDGTIELLRAADPALTQWVSEADAGQADALRKALALARQPWVGWLNADEFYEPGAFDIVRRAAAANPDAAVIYGDFKRVLRNGDVIRTNRTWRFDYEVCRIQTPIIMNCAAFFSRQALVACGGFDPTWHCLMDWELYLRLLRGGAKAVRVREVLGNFTMHPASKTASAPEKFSAEIRRLRHREFPGLTEAAAERKRLLQLWRMRAHMLADGVIWEKVWFKIARQWRYADYFGSDGVRVPVLSPALGFIDQLARRTGRQ